MRHAREGYICIAADYFFRHPDQAALHRGDVGYDMTDPESVELLDVAIDAVSREPQADMTRLAIMGVCQTGRHPLVLAAHRPISAALVWYGAAQDRDWNINEKFPVGLEEFISKSDCPVLGMFGETDHIISLANVRRFRDCLERYNRSFHIEIFGAAPHGWLNDTMPGRYRREQAERAWQTQRDFLAKVFDPASDKTFIGQTYNAQIAPTYDFSKNVRFE
jgi:carboxymethylenebutenolidase